MPQSEFHILLDKYLAGELTPEEQQVWAAGLHRPEWQQLLEQHMRTAFEEGTYETEETAERGLRLNTVLSHKTGFTVQDGPEQAAMPALLPARQRKAGWWRWAAAAALLLTAGVAWWQLQPHTVSKTTTPAATAAINPGKNGAVLTLADGRVIQLDSLQAGVVAEQSGTRLALQQGVLSYQQAADNGQPPAYNTITIPKGYQYILQLPDSSRVWLNSESSIRFPVFFRGNERKVSMTGEAYFEVTQNKNAVFQVQAGEAANVKVLGTAFNIRAYADEPSAATTLLQGSVQVQPLATTAQGSVQGQQPAATNGMLLKPGQQAAVDKTTGKARLFTQVDVDGVVAWKNGLFHLEGRTFSEVMSELARWYNLEVVYPNGIPDIQLGGEISRREPLAEVLHGLQDAKVKFIIEDNRRLVVQQAAE